MNSGSVYTRPAFSIKEVNLRLIDMRFNLLALGNAVANTRLP
jgi:hypothetical protein